MWVRLKKISDLQTKNQSALMGVVQVSALNRKKPFPQMFKFYLII